MRSVRRAAAVSLSAMLVLGGCAGDDAAPSTPTSAPATTAPPPPSTRPAEALMAALLRLEDVPGSVPSPLTPGELDLSACFPDNPLGARAEPNQVTGLSLQRNDGTVVRQYRAWARQGPAEQAEALVATLASPSGSICVVDTYKRVLGQGVAKVDTSGVTGTGKAAAVGDGGAVVGLGGQLTGDAPPVQIGLDLVVFHKGTVVVFLVAAALRGATVPGEALEVARKIDGRLS